MKLNRVGQTYCKKCNQTIQKEGNPDLDLMMVHKCKHLITFKHSGELDKEIQDKIINILNEEEAEDIIIDFINSEN